MVSTVVPHVSTQQALAATPTEIEKEGVSTVLNTPPAAVRYLVLKGLDPEHVGTFTQERQRSWQDYINERFPGEKIEFDIPPDPNTSTVDLLAHLWETGQADKFLGFFARRVGKNLVGAYMDLLDPTLFLGSAGKVVKALTPAKVSAPVGAAVGKVVAPVTAAVAKGAAAVGVTGERLAAANVAGGELLRKVPLIETGRKVLSVFSKKHELTADLRRTIMPIDEARIMGQNQANAFLKRVEFEAGDIRAAATERISDRKIIDALESTDEAGELAQRLQRINEPERKLYDLYAGARADVQAQAEAQLKARALGKSPDEALLSAKGTEERFRALRQTEQGVAQAERGAEIFAVKEAAINVKALEGVRRRVDQAVDALKIPEGEVRAGLVRALNEKVDDVIRSAERRGGRSGALTVEEAEEQAAKTISDAQKKASKLSPDHAAKVMEIARENAKRTKTFAAAERPAGRALSAAEFKALKFDFLEPGAIAGAARRGAKKAKKTPPKPPVTDLDKEVQALLRKHFTPKRPKGPAAAPAAPELPKAPKEKPPLRSISAVTQAEDTARAARVFRKIGARLQAGKPLTPAAKKVLERYRPVLERERASVKRKMSAINYVFHLKTKDEAVKVASKMMTSKSVGRTTVGPRRTLPGKLYEIERMLGKDFFKTDLDEIMQAGLAKGLDAVVNARTMRDFIEDGVKNGYMNFKQKEGWHTVTRDPYNLLAGPTGQRIWMPKEVAKFAENHWITRDPGNVVWESFKKVNQWIHRDFISSSPVSLVRDTVSDSVMMLHHSRNPVRAYANGRRIDKISTRAAGPEREELLELIEHGVLDVPLFATDAAKAKKLGTRAIDKVMALPILVPTSGQYVRRKVSEWARIGLFHELRRGGDTAAEAARKVKMALLDYDPRSFSAAENNLLKPLIPFYSFFRRNAETQGRMLMGANGARGFAISIFPQKLKQIIEGGQTRDERFEWESTMAIQMSRGLHWDPKNFFAQSDFFDTLERIGRGEFWEIGSERSGPLLWKKIYETGVNKSLYTGRALVSPAAAGDTFLGNLAMTGIGQDGNFLGMDIDQRWIHLLSVFRGFSELARVSRKGDDRVLSDKVLNGLGWPRGYEVQPEKVAKAKHRAFAAKVGVLRKKYAELSKRELEAADREAAGQALIDLKTAIYNGRTQRQLEILREIDALKPR